MPPPVIILNLAYSGLGIARDLAGRGIRLVGFSAVRKAYGNFTRFCEVWIAPSSRDEPERLAEFLLRAANELQGAVIFPTCDLDIVFLDRFRSALEPCYRLSIPPRHCIQQVINKHALVSAARQAGVAVPRTVLVRGPAELQRVPEEIGFPSVLKPLSSFQWDDNTRQVSGERKALRVDCWEQLSGAYDWLAEIHPEILVQEWIPGKARELVILGGYVGENSEPLAFFTARKIVQFPEDFGTGCLVESEGIPELLEPTQLLWRALAYQGMAEVEYKRDPRTREFKLIEINARHWDWHQLGTPSGVNLSWVAYRHLTRNLVTPTRPLMIRVKWIAEDTLLRSLYRRQISAQELSNALAGRRMYGIFAWTDPIPFICYSVTAIITIIKRYFGLSRGKRKPPE